ncbi:MAG: lamin tail domain-containing protein [Caldilineaceae bacterium]|nr:lamin tail domain-containing protein [Caldilineaceae bacterium]
MSRSQLAFVILMNAIISLVIALAVVALFERRRPDPEELAALYTPVPGAVMAATATLADITTLPTSAPVTPETLSPDSGQSTSVSNGDEIVHVVEAGESLGSIAARYGVTLDALVQANGLINPDFVFSGQRLVIPGTGDSAAPAVQAEGGVEITGINNAGDLAQEVVLIANESNTPFNLTGWQLGREGGPTYTFGNVQLFPGSGVEVYSAAGEDDSRRLYWAQNEAQWTAGSSARLRNAAGVEVDAMTIE